MGRLLNIDSKLKVLDKLGIVNKPLDEYANEFESGLISCGEFASGVPTEKSDTVSTIDCGTY